MHFTPLFLVIIAFIVLAIVFALMKAKLGNATEASGDGSAYELRGAILTPAERSFIGVLENSLPDGIGLLAKVRLGDIFKPRKGISPSLRARAGNKINQKHVDFLLVRTSDLIPVAGVELDDSSHQRSDRIKRDAFVDEVFATCKLPLLHVPAQTTYNTAELRKAIAALIPT